MQGSLFGAPEPTVHAAKNKVSTGDLLALNAGDDNLRNKDLSDADLSDDALTRPRRRREADGVEADCVDETNGNSTQMSLPGPTTANCSRSSSPPYCAITSN